MKLKNQSVLSFIKDKKASSHNGDIHLYLYTFKIEVQFYKG